ncbi:MFS transporter [Streptomyces sp. UH6]|nr:MFS transporter [Streptomyces sp. UH6]
MRRVTTAVVLTAELMSTLDGSLLYTVLPSIQASTGATTAQVQWIHAAYALTFALGLVTGGRLGDLHGRRRVFLAGTAVFTFASLLCGTLTEPAPLVAARLLQGAAAAAMVPQVLAVLHVTHDGTDAAARSRVFALYGTVLSLGSVIGPVLGAALTGADLFGLGWRTVFLINVPLGLAVLLLGRRHLPESTEHGARRLDPLGVVLSALGLLLVVWPLTAGGGHGRAETWRVLTLLAGLLVLTGFVLQQRVRASRGRDPLVALGLFRSRAFSGGVTTALVFGLLSGVFFLIWTLFMQAGLGLSPGQAAVGFAAASLGELGGAWAGALLAARFGRRAPQGGALLAAAALGVHAWSVVTYGTGLPWAASVVPMLVLGLGAGMVGATLAEMTLSGVAHDLAGSASGLYNTATQLGMAVGTALTSVLFFAHAPAGSRGAVVTDAFTGAIGYVIGAFLVMWALMFLLPRHTRN